MFPNNEQIKLGFTHLQTLQMVFSTVAAVLWTVAALTLDTTQNLIGRIYESITTLFALSKSLEMWYYEVEEVYLRVARSVGGGENLLVISILIAYTVFSTRAVWRASADQTFSNYRTKLYEIIPYPTLTQHFLAPLIGYLYGRPLIFLLLSFIYQVSYELFSPNVAEVPKTFLTTGIEHDVLRSATPREVVATPANITITLSQQPNLSAQMTDAHNSVVNAIAETAITQPDPVLISTTSDLGERENVSTLRNLWPTLHRFGNNIRFPSHIMPEMATAALVHTLPRVRYLVELVAYSEINGVKNYWKAGNGFYITVKNRSWIVTALHVVEEISRVGQLQICVDGKALIPTTSFSPLGQDTAVLLAPPNTGAVLGIRPARIAPLNLKAPISIISVENGVYRASTGCPPIRHGYGSRMYQSDYNSGPGLSGSPLVQNDTIVALHTGADTERQLNICESLILLLPSEALAHANSRKMYLPIETSIRNESSIPDEIQYEEVEFDYDDIRRSRVTYSDEMERQFPSIVAYSDAYDKFVKVHKKRLNGELIDEEERYQQETWEEVDRLTAKYMSENYRLSDVSIFVNEYLRTRHIVHESHLTPYGMPSLSQPQVDFHEEHRLVKPVVEVEESSNTANSCTMDFQRRQEDMLLRQQALMEALESRLKESKPTETPPISKSQVSPLVTEKQTISQSPLADPETKPSQNLSKSQKKNRRRKLLKDTQTPLTTPPQISKS